MLFSFNNDLTFLIFIIDIIRHIRHLNNIFKFQGFRYVKFSEIVRNISNLIRQVTFTFILCNNINKSLRNDDVFHSE